MKETTVAMLCTPEPLLCVWQVGVCPVTILAEHGILLSEIGSLFIRERNDQTQKIGNSKENHRRSPASPTCYYCNRCTLLPISLPKISGAARAAARKGHDCGNGWAILISECDVLDDIFLSLLLRCYRQAGALTANRALRGGVDY